MEEIIYDKWTGKKDFETDELSKESKEGLLVELRKRLNAAFANDPMGTHEKILQFSHKIVNKYPNFSNCELYHLLIWIC